MYRVQRMSPTLVVEVGQGRGTGCWAGAGEASTGWGGPGSSWMHLLNEGYMKVLSIVFSS